MSRGALFRVGLCNVLISFGLGTVASIYLFGMDAWLAALGVACLGTGLFGHAINLGMHLAERGVEREG